MLALMITKPVVTNGKTLKSLTSHFKWSVSQVIKWDCRMMRVLT